MAFLSVIQRREHRQREEKVAWRILCSRRLHTAQYRCKTFSLYLTKRRQNAPEDLHVLGLCSHLVPEHGARVQFALGTNVNAPLYQVSTPEFGHGVHAPVQGRHLVFGN